MLEDPINMTILIMIVVLLCLAELDLIAYAVILLVYIYEEKTSKEGFDNSVIDISSEDIIENDELPIKTPPDTVVYQPPVHLPPYDQLTLNNITNYETNYAKYQGNIHMHEKLKLHPHQSNDRLVEAMLNRPGTDYKRQLIGRKNKKNYLNRFIGNDIEHSENRPWWHNYDL